MLRSIIALLAAAAFSTISVYGGGVRFRPAPPAVGTAQILDSTRGPGGTVWFAAKDLYALGVLHPDGMITTVPTDYWRPTSVATGPDGTVWFLASSRLGRVTTSGVVEYFNVPSEFWPYTDLLVTPDGYVWIVGYCSPKIWRMDAMGQFVSFSTGSQSDDCPSHLALGSDGAVWYSKYYGTNIGRITSTGQVTEYPLPAGVMYPNDLELGGDGNLYFGVRSLGIYRVTPQGVITTFDASSENATLGASTDGTLWATARSYSQGVETITIRQYRLSDGAVLNELNGPAGAAVDTVVVASDTVVVSMAAPDRFARLRGPSMDTVPAAVLPSDPSEMVAAPDGRIWFTEKLGNRIRVLEPDGRAISYTIPSGSTKPNGLALGGDGAMWFTEQNGDSIGRIDSNGAITEFPLLSYYGEGAGITVGADGHLWFALNAAEKLGRMSLTGETTEYPLPAGIRPRRVAGAADGSIWFTVDSQEVVGRFVPSSSSVEFLPVGSVATEVIRTIDGGIAVAVGSSVGIYDSKGYVRGLSAPSSRISRLAQLPNGDFIGTHSAGNLIFAFGRNGYKYINTYSMTNLPLGIATIGSRAWIAAPGNGRIAVVTRDVDDVDLSGSSDLLLRNTVTGQNALWLLDRGQFSGIRDLPVLANPGYELCASGDFNRDLETELVWRNSSTGQNALWDLKDGQVTVFDLPGVGGDFKIAAAGDFDGNGSDDLVWRNPTTGQNALWLMNGREFSRIVDLPAVAGANLKIVAAADMNSDGFVDLVWRNSLTGANTVWTMNGTTFSAVETIPALPNTNYVIGGVTDTDSDGKNDIIWRNQTTGQNAIWRFNGLQFLGVTDLPALENPNWTFVGPR